MGSPSQKAAEWPRDVATVLMFLQEMQPLPRGEETLVLSEACFHSESSESWRSVPCWIKHTVRSNTTSQEAHQPFKFMKLYTVYMKLFKSVFSILRPYDTELESWGSPPPSFPNTVLYSWGRELWVSQASQLESNSCIFRSLHDFL